MSDYNPYATPAKTGAPMPVPTGGGYVEEKTLVIPRVGYVMPAMCAKCGMGTNKRWKAKLQWNPRWVPLLVLVCTPAYLLAFILTRKVAQVDVGICETHDQRRRVGQIAALAGIVILLGGVFAGVWADNPGIMFGGLIVGLVVLIIGAVSAAILQPVYMDEQWAKFNGVHQDVLQAIVGNPPR